MEQMGLWGTQLTVREHPSSHKTSLCELQTRRLWRCPFRSRVRRKRKHSRPEHPCDQAAFRVPGLHIARRVAGDGCAPPKFRRDWQPQIPLQPSGRKNRIRFPPDIPPRDGGLVMVAPPRCGGGALPRPEQTPTRPRSHQYFYDRRIKEG